ncbi:MAG TPA: carboxymuconolactone decarboxylase family protein [Jatrophihabitantaceae bacterium]|nr:carboxymuconolactone decarboxylase family protein [Jatrophihabitantaceae bacterium]
MTAPRIAPGTRREVGLFAWAFSTISGRVTRTNPPNLFLTMSKRRSLFRGWLFFAGRLMPGGKLPRRDTELVILRVAHLRNCAYEFEHHVHLGKRAGITAADVTRVQSGPDAEGWSSREHVLLSAVDELHRDSDLSDTTWTQLREHLDEPRAIEFLMLVGHYEMLATFLNTVRIQPDRHR